MFSKFVSLFSCVQLPEDLSDDTYFQKYIDAFLQSKNKKYLAFYDILILVDQNGYYPTDASLLPKDMLVHLAHYRTAILKEKGVDIAHYHKFFGSSPMSIKMDMIIHTGLFTMEMIGITVDENGQSLVHHAVKLKNLAMLKCLLETGAEPNLRDKNGKTPLFYGRGESVKMLLKYGGDPFM